MLSFFKGCKMGELSYWWWKFMLYCLSSPQLIYSEVEASSALAEDVRLDRSRLSTLSRSCARLT